MTKLALSAAAMLLAMSSAFTTSAFAGSDHFGPCHVNRAAATVHITHTAAIRKADMVRHGVQATMQSDVQEPGQGIWGN